MQLDEYEITSGNFTYLPIDKVYFGPVQIKELSQELDRLDSKKPFIITGTTIATQTNLIEKLESSGGRTFAGVFSSIKQHTPSHTVNAAREEAVKAHADCLISLGGGSPIDATKILVRQLSDNFQKKPLPHVAVPTTLSAAEFSHSAGYTDESSNRKTGIRDPRMVPRTVFLDPELTVETPRWLWSSTGIRSLDHAIEAVYSPNHQLYVDTLALKAISLLFQNLPRTMKQGSDSTSVSACQLAAWMSYAGAYNVGTGLSHAIGRVIGATWNIPHGITSCITLSQVMREQARKNPTPFILIARAEGVSIDGLSEEQIAQAATEGVRNLVTSLGLSKRLGDYGITKKDLPIIAKEVSTSESYAEVLKILENIL